MSEASAPSDRGNAPEVRMDGVKYERAIFRQPFVVSLPITDEWLLYVIRHEGVVFNAVTMPSAGDTLEKNTVLGLSGRIEHSFSWGETGARKPFPWVREHGDAAFGSGGVAITAGRVPQTTMPFITSADFIVRIEPSCEPGLVSRIVALVDWIEAEQMRSGVETEAIVRRLAEVITLEIGRFELSRSVIFGSKRLHSSNADPRIWRAIAAFSHSPEEHWTVEKMAEIASMSRTSFAVHYRMMVGTTPLKSLRQLRMQRAASVLAAPNAGCIAELAQAMGYGSEAAFCRAFAKEFGHPPRRYGARAATTGNPSSPVYTHAE